MKTSLISQNKYKQGLKTLKTSLIALFLTLLVGAIVIEISGFSAIDTYIAIFTGSLGTEKGRVLSLSQGTPLLLTGLSFAIAFRVRIINTGVEGQLYIGAITSAIVGAYVTFLPGPLHVAAAILTGMLAGGLVGLFIGYLKIKFDSSEVIVGIMLNEILILVTTWLSTGPLKSEGSAISQTNMILDSAKLTKIVPRSQLTTAIIMAVIIAIVLEWMLRKTALGYEIQVTGSNLQAARTAGIQVSKVYLFTIFLSGAIAGLAGCALSLGIHYRFIENISTGLGFSGIPVAALAAYSPLGVVFSSILFGVLKAGAMTLNRTTSIPIEFVSMIQALVVVFVAAPKMISSIGYLVKSPFTKLIKNKGNQRSSNDEIA
ncbi:ABC transporter permease [Tissierella carlieri]|uniref:ABC transporter permease n=1 Tax=Tissierella carlieri TaxID=689904 RepID=A0ABT1S7H8_9FIRM|nr:ABC transporter permease [Tissierella carlieri]MCQ4922430.1 ABC transporter permease [Tissierella carlieri]